MNTHVSQANVIINDNNPLHLFSSITITCNQNFQNTWYLDSKATQHMTLVKKWFNTYQILSHPCPIYIGDDSPLNVVGIGFVAIKLQIGHVIIIDEILHVLKKLLSISQVTIQGTSQVIFSFGLCITITIIRTSQPLVLKCQPVSWLFPTGVGLYFIVQYLSKDNIYSSTNIIHLHHRMGYIDITSLLHMQQYNLVKGLPPKKNRNPKNRPKNLSHSSFGHVFS
jgi:hypothetical protein